MNFYRTFFAALVTAAVISPMHVSAAEPAVITKNIPVVQTVAIVKINVNSATAKELSKVSGLNAAKAKSIVSYRKKHGEFKSLEELSKVRAIKKLKPEQVKGIQDQLSLT